MTAYPNMQYNHYSASFRTIFLNGALPPDVLVYWLRILECVNIWRALGFIIAAPKYTHIISHIRFKRNAASICDFQMDIEQNLGMARRSNIPEE